MRIAVVGAGIAGLTAAYRLLRHHDVTVYEAADWIGGHTHTVDVEMSGEHFAVDTGFIVFNDWTYPNFIALLEELGVRSQPSNMSFSLRCERTGLEYNGTSVNALFAQRRNLASPSFLRMVADILRFNARCRELLRDGDDTLRLIDYLRAGGYSRSFVDYYILPMGKAIWSASGSAMLQFPARFFVEFFDRHGFLNINHRPRWRTVCGGAREYVRALTNSFRARIRTRARVTGVQREAARVSVRSARGDVEHFDQVVLACHSDQALALLEQPTPQEQEILGAFPYQENEAVLHTDAALLPRNPRARAAWNYHAPDSDQDRVALTYDMNVLQSIQSQRPLLVTLNRDDIEPSQVLQTFTYHHPVYLPAGVAAQKRRREISGVNRTLYCGAYWRYGFHEDGVVSAQRAVQDLELSTDLTMTRAARAALAS